MSPDEPDRRMRRAATALALVALLAAACVGGPTPTPRAPELDVDLSILVRRDQGPGPLVFESEAHARLSLESRWTTEWTVPEGLSSMLAPADTVGLEMWTVVQGDVIECTTDPMTGQELCTQPVSGTGQVCELVLDLAADAPAAVEFTILQDERCGLVLAAR